MRRRLQRFRVLPFAALVLSFGFLPEVVLCIGDNGHQAFEFVTQTCCHPESPEDADCPSPNEHCSTECNDLRLAADVILSKSSDQDLARDGFAKISPVVPASVTSLPTLRSPLVGIRWSENATFAPSPRKRHTTVQLC